MAIVYPMKARLNTRWTLFVVLITWVISSLISIPAVIYQRVVSEDGRLVCYPLWPEFEMRIMFLELAINSELFALIYDSFLMILNYIIPLVVLCITYTRVGFVLWKSQIGESTPQQGENIKAKRKVFLIITTVLII